MKTFILITLAAGLGLSASAQQGYYDNRDHQSFPDQSYYHRRDNNEWERSQRMADINNDYDNRIRLLREQRFGRARERRQQIRDLERERALALQQCRDGYSAPYASGYDVPRPRVQGSVTVHIGF